MTINVMTTYLQDFINFFNNFERKVYLIVNNQEKEELYNIVNNFYPNYYNTIKNFKEDVVFSCIVFIYFNYKGKPIRYGTFHTIFKIERGDMIKCLNIIEKGLKSIMEKLNIKEPDDKDEVVLNEIKESLKKYYNNDQIFDCLFPCVKEIYKLVMNDLRKTDYWDDGLIFNIWKYILYPLYKKRIINYKLTTTDFSKIFGMAKNSIVLKNIPQISKNIEVIIDGEIIKIKFKNKTIKNYNKSRLMETYANSNKRKGTRITLI